MDTQQFLGLFQEVLARELNTLPSLLSPVLTPISGYKSSEKSHCDSPYRILPSARVTHYSATVNTLTPGFPTSTISCHAGPYPCTKALETLARCSKSTVSPATIGGHPTRRGKVSQTRSLPSYHCYCQNRFGGWGVAGCLQCLATSCEQSQRTTARSGDLPSLHKS